MGWGVLDPHLASGYLDRPVRGGSCPLAPEAARGRIVEASRVHRLRFGMRERVEAWGGRCAALVLTGLLAALPEAGCHRGTPEGAPTADAEIPQPGQFVSDSLGVGLVLPNSPGWSFRREPPTPGGPYITAVHQSQRASVRLYVHPKPEAVNLDEVIRRRRDQLAGFFHVRDLDLLVERVIREGRQPIHDYAAWQWQAVTQPVAVAGEAPSRVMFLSEAVERPDRIFEMLGLLRFPAAPSSAQDDSTRALLEDLSFVMQSLQVR